MLEKVQRKDKKTRKINCKLICWWISKTFSCG